MNKETQIFKFSDYSWKLVAKMEKANTLVIYLKLEDNGEDVKTKIVSLYFLLSLNKQNEGELTPQHIVVEKGSTIPLCEFRDHELHEYDEQKLEFTVYLNADQTLTTAINYLYLNLEQVMQLYPVGELEMEDVLVLLKATPRLQKPQDQALLYLLAFLPKVQYTQHQQEQLLDALDYQAISPEVLDNSIAISAGFLRQKLQHKKDRPSHTKKTTSSRVLESRGRNLNQSDRSFVDHMQNRTLNEIETNNSSIVKGQSVDRNDISVLRDMPLNKLEKLKKNSASNTRIGKSSEPRPFEAQQAQKQPPSPAERKKAVLNEINIVNFLKVPSLYKELNDVIAPFLK